MEVRTDFVLAVLRQVLVVDRGTCCREQMEVRTDFVRAVLRQVLVVDGPGMAESQQAVRGAVLGGTVLRHVLPEQQARQQLLVAKASGRQGLHGVSWGRVCACVRAFVPACVCVCVCVRARALEKGLQTFVRYMYEDF